MTVTIADDDECTDGAQKHDEVINGTTTRDFTIRKCRCEKGYFVKARDVSYCGSVTSCVPCPAGTACTGEESLEEILLLPGKYRTSNTSTAVVDCPTPDACKGTLLKTKSLDQHVAQDLQEKIDKDNVDLQEALKERLANSPDDLSNWGDALCKLGHTGAFCQVCTVEATVAYYWSGQSCEKCEGEKGNAMAVFFVIVVGIVVFGVLHISGFIDKLIKKAAKKAELKFPQRVKQLKALKKLIEDGSLQTKCEFHAGSHFCFNRRFYQDVVVGCLQSLPMLWCVQLYVFTHDPIAPSS
jgi:hypothetical protein